MLELEKYYIELCKIPLAKHRDVARDIIKHIINDVTESNCNNCEYCANVYSYNYPLCVFDKQEPFQVHNSNKLKCNDHKMKEIE